MASRRLGAARPSPAPPTTHTAHPNKAVRYGTPYIDRMHSALRRARWRGLTRPCEFAPYAISPIRIAYAPRDAYERRLIDGVAVSQLGDQRAVRKRVATMVLSAYGIRPENTYMGAVGAFHRLGLTHSLGATLINPEIFSRCPAPAAKDPHARLHRYYTTGRIVCLPVLLPGRRLRGARGIPVGLVRFGRAGLVVFTGRFGLPVVSRARCAYIEMRDAQPNTRGPRLTR